MAACPQAHAGMLVLLLLVLEALLPLSQATEDLLAGGLLPVLEDDVLRGDAIACRAGIARRDRGDGLVVPPAWRRPQHSCS